MNHRHDPSSSLTCSQSPDEVAKIAALLLWLASRSVGPPGRTASGYRLRLRVSDEVQAALRDFVQRDRDCCPFLEFTIDAGPQEVRLEVTGPEGAWRILETCFELARLAAARGSVL